MNNIIFTNFLDTTTLFIAQAAPGAGGSGMSFVLIMGLMLVGMYFLMIAPQRKQQKQHKLLLESLKKGDQILTAGGIYGSVLHVKDDRVSIRVDSDVKMEINKQSITTRISKDGEK